MKENLYLYKIKEIVKVVDGDTVDITVDLGFYISFTIRIRLTGFDAPEIYRPFNEKEYKAGVKVKDYLSILLNKYKDSLYVRTSKLPGIYGRWGGEIFIQTKNNSFISINKLVQKFIEDNHYTKEELRDEEVQ